MRNRWVVLALAVVARTAMGFQLQAAAAVWRLPRRRRTSA
jgi:hypothetical protein